MTTRRPRRIAVAQPAHRRRRLTVDDEGFVFLGRAKICRYNRDDRSLEFLDKTREAKRNGSRVVKITLDEFTQELGGYGGELEK